MRQETELALLPIRIFWAMLPMSLSCALCGLVGILRASPTPVIRLGVPAFLLLAIEFSTIIIFKKV